jgi:GT2 family glycosyltransferase
LLPERTYQRVARERAERVRGWQENAANLQPLSAPAVDLICPTMDNGDKLVPFVSSLLSHTDEATPFRLIIVNNGTPGYVSKIIPEHPKIQVIEAGGNKGWEGGIALGAQHSKSPIIGMVNDDIHIVPGDPKWLLTMLESFGTIPKCGSVGPCSNVVMQRQNLFYMGLAAKAYYTSLLIGFCVLYRRDLYDIIGGMTQGLPGGDDLDLSIRVEKAGWRPVMRRDVFVYHHGFSTGTKLHGEYWNSMEMQEKTRQTLIRLHGVSAFLRCINGFVDDIP